MSAVEKAATISHMQKRRSLLLTAFFFLILAVGILAAFRSPLLSPVRGSLEGILLPVQRSFYSIFAGGVGNEDEPTEMQKLRMQIAQQRKIEDDVKALRDQFETSEVSSRKLLPASIIGARGLIPGISHPSEFIIDKGTADGVIKGQVAVYQENVVGVITEVSLRASRISVVSHRSSTFTGKTAKTNALGVVVGQGNGVMLLGNVVLSEKLEASDLVLTKGDADLQGKGYPPDLIVGKIVKIDRRPSALFQTAEVKSSLNFSKLTDVFIIISE